MHPAAKQTCLQAQQPARPEPAGQFDRALRRSSLRAAIQAGRSEITRRRLHVADKAEL